MIEPTQPGTPSSLPINASENIPQLSRQMQEALYRFSDHLQKILDQPSLSKEQEFEKQFVHAIKQLNQLVQLVQQIR